MTSMSLLSHKTVEFPCIQKKRGGKEEYENYDHFLAIERKHYIV